MAKYDAVDRLMNLATDKATPKATPTAIAEKPVQPLAVQEAEAVLEARVVAVEPGRPPVAGSIAGRSMGTTASSAPSRPANPYASPNASEAGGATARAHAKPGPGERGRQLLSALRPFLPVVGGALRMIDHGAVQTVARLLPLLGGSGIGTATPAAPAADTQHPLSGVLTTLDQRHSAVLEELKRLKARSEAQEEQLRRIRDSQERAIAEQGTQGHLLHLLADRSRLLTAGVIILFMLVVAEAVLLLITMHR